jgi:hypothetical protein
MKKKRFARFIIATMALCLVFAVPVTSYADSSTARQSNVEQSIVEVVREDIPIAQALKDASFNPALAKAYPEIKTTSKAVYWDCWGGKINLDGYGGGTPTGTSVHKNGSTVLNTYHYTRTFLNTQYDPRGDSSYKWGYGTVTATGTYCINDVWTCFIHRVYYGTTTQ